MTNDNHAHSKPGNVFDLAELREAKRLAQEIAPDQFGDGPWKLEPNSAEWVDEETGYPCMILRENILGHLCGYVGVWHGHRAFGKHFDTGVVDAVRIHGGLTYSSFKGRSPNFALIDKPWWFGFDCAHAGDLIPALDVGALKKFKAELEAEMKDVLERLVERPYFLESKYRTFAWVTDEVTNLANQLGMIEALEL